MKYLILGLFMVMISGCTVYTSPVGVGVSVQPVIIAPAPRYYEPRYYYYYGHRIIDLYIINPIKEITNGNN